MLSDNLTEPGVVSGREVHCCVKTLISITNLYLLHREVKLYIITEEGSVTEVTVAHTAVLHM